MEKISVFEMFKIGIGPSSSHAMGPWNASKSFLQRVKNNKGSLNDIKSINITLFGSLSKTGRGHGTDKAIMMGLMGFDIKNFRTNQLAENITKIKSSRSISLLKEKKIVFDPKKNIIFDISNKKLKYSNTIKFDLNFKNDISFSSTYYSLGGGFIKYKGEKVKSSDKYEIPYPIQTAKEMIHWCEVTNRSIADLSMANELCWLGKNEIDLKLKLLWEVMQTSIYDGCNTKGILPGGLEVQRRAYGISHDILEGKKYRNQNEWVELIKQEPNDMENVTKWVSCFALAVNEVNASYGRIVTAPTNGAAGVIPAVIAYYYYFNKNVNIEDINLFLLVAGEIGMLFKKGATISAAAGGCQAEIGVSSAMAASGLTFSLGGNIYQILMAAEIAMEHHLGLSCDPVGGLVQIPCIERNTMGAIKAITAAQLALHGNPKDAKVSLDDVIKTMWKTAQDMNSKYKETAEGGLALQISVNEPEC